MTDQDDLQTLKSLAKRYARATRADHIEALDLVATKMGFPHWVSLAKAHKKGWLPRSEQLTEIESFVSESCGLDPEAMEEGMIRDHPYQLTVFSGDVHISGDGWCVCVPEAPSAKPFVEFSEKDDRDNPINDPSFLEEVLRLTKDRATKVRARIASDWPRRSTKPNAMGEVVHPLWKDAIEAKHWFCLHCDGKIISSSLAENFWHCPRCDASPIDIFATPFWLEGSDKKPEAVQPSQRDHMTMGAIEMRDTTPTLELDEGKIELFIRMALLDDAATPGERMAALMAEINVIEPDDDDEDEFGTIVYVRTDMDLWPEDKAPKHAIAVAKLLGVELEEEMTAMTFPFHWPALAAQTKCTAEYVKSVLDAYAEYESKASKTS